MPSIATHRLAGRAEPLEFVRPRRRVVLVAFRRHPARPVDDDG